MGSPPVITLCGSSRFCDIMAVVAWILERDEGAIAMDLHLLPWWYSPADIPDHLAEHEGVSDAMDQLHLRKIDLSDAIFVIDADVDDTPYIGPSTATEIAYAEGRGVPVRRFSSPEEEHIRLEVYRRMLASIRARKQTSGTPPGNNEIEK